MRVSTTFAIHVDGVGDEILRAAQRALALGYDVAWTVEKDRLVGFIATPAGPNPVLWHQAQEHVEAIKTPVPL